MSWPPWPEADPDAFALLEKTLAFHDRTGSGMETTFMRLFVGGLHTIFVHPIEEGMDSDLLTVTEEVWPLERIREIRTAHAGNNPTKPDWPIVVVHVAGRDLLVDGNNRVNLWVRERREQNPVLLVSMI